MESVEIINTAPPHEATRGNSNKEISSVLTKAYSALQMRKNKLKTKQASQVWKTDKPLTEDAYSKRK